MTDTIRPVEFDPFSDAFFNDPTEMYRRLRDESPVYYSEKYGFYALSCFADVLSAHRDWEGFSSAHGVELFMLSKDPAEVKSYRSIIMMDPPEHDRFRALVSRVFTPRAVTSLEPMIREVICGFLDQLNDRGEFDVVADFAAPFPVEVISRMLGVPEGERQQIRHWLDSSLRRETGQLAPTPENDQAFLESGVYFYELTAAKRESPGDDMLSRLTQVTVDRGDGEETGLDNAEIAGFATLLGGAGAETVTKLVGNAAVLFDRHPEQWQKVVADPEKIPRRSRRSSATGRRRNTKGASAPRIASSKAAPFPPDSPCCSSRARRRRDPRAFERADDFDIERVPGITIGLGHGTHSCLGAALAHGEPDRHRGVGLAVATPRDRRSRPPPSADGQRRRLFQRAGSCPALTRQISFAATQPRVVLRPWTQCGSSRCVEMSVMMRDGFG